MRLIKNMKCSLFLVPVIFSLSACSMLVLRTPPLPKGAQLVFSDDFSRGLKNWVTEGVGPYGIVNGQIVFDSRLWDYKGYRARNVWCKYPLPEKFRIQFDIEPLEPKPDEKRGCNLLFALCAQMSDPKRDLLKESANRTAHYIFLTHVMKWRSYRGDVIKGREIPPMKNYTITYYRISPKGEYKLVVRKNPGFHLLMEVPQKPSEVRAARRRIVIEKVGGIIRFFENGRQWFSILDDGSSGSVLKGGYFGVRGWRIKAALDNVKIYKLP